jgi:hypothetical protein
MTHGRIPHITLHDMAETLRKMAREPLDAERKVGAMYGHVFRNKEIRYDASGGRWLGEPEWS